MLWPRDMAYRKCPLCDGFTEWLNGATAIPDSEANAIVAERRDRLSKHQAFEAFYAEREDTRFLAEIGATFANAP